MRCFPVIASVAKQIQPGAQGQMDCFVARAPRNDGETVLFHGLHFESGPGERSGMRCLSKDSGHSRAFMVLRAMPPGRANARPNTGSASSGRRRATANIVWGRCERAPPHREDLDLMTREAQFSRSDLIGVRRKVGYACAPFRDACVRTPV